MGELDFFGAEVQTIIVEADLTKGGYDALGFARESEGFEIREVGLGSAQVVFDLLGAARVDSNGCVDETRLGINNTFSD